MKKSLQKILNSGSAVLFIFAIALTVLFTTQANAQVNIALTATANHSGGGSAALGYGPANYNDGILPPYGCTPTPCGWGWVSGNGWIDYEWTTPQTISSIVFYWDNRPMTSCTIQIWDGIQYVNILSYTRPAAATQSDSVVLTTPAVTTKLRFNTVAGSNPNHREIRVYQRITAGNDAGLSAFTSPGAFCPSTQMVSVRVNNYGINRIDSVLVNWSVDGVAKPSKWMTTMLDTIGGTLPTFAILNLDTLQFPVNSSKNVVAWTSFPNNVADTVNYNDTLSATFAPAISGTYTVNGGLASGGTNFNSFADLSSFLNANGVCGPVVIDVINKGSSYAEQLTLGNINGSSATNTITINGNGQTITSSGGTQYATVFINGASHIKIKKLNIEASGTTTNFGLSITNGASFIEVDSCTIAVNQAATATSTAAVSISGSTTLATTAGNSGTNISITNCDISGGYYGLTLTGPASTTTASNNVIQNNHIHDFYLYGTWFTNQINTTVKGNNVNRKSRTGTVTTFYGVYLNGVMEGMKIEGNKIHSPADQNPTASFTSYPIYFTAANGSATNPLVLTNNAVYNINGIGTTYGVYLLSGNFINLYHNTVSLDNTLATGTLAQRAFFLAASSGTFNVRNNLFSVTHGGSGAKHVIYLSSTVPTFTIDYNHYNLGSTNGTNFLGYYSATNVNTFTDWQAVNNGAFDQNGVFGDPIFDTSAFKPQSTAGNNAGANLLTIVPTDIIDVARTATPDPGAIEYVPLPCLQPIVLGGSSTPTSITINWNNDPDADSVGIEYGGQGFVQGTGTNIYTTDSTITITGLTSQTCFDFYLKTWCGGSVGNGQALFTYCTQCGVKTLPLSENFDNNPGGTSTLVQNTPDCWTYINTSGSTSVYGYNYNALAPLSPLNHWRMYAGVVHTGVLALASPSIDGLTAGNKRVKFWAKSNSTTPTRMYVGTMSNPDLASTITILDTFLAPQAYTEFTTNITTATGYNGTDNYIVFVLGNTATGQSLYIDDILIQQIPLCNPPTSVTVPALTSTTAQVAWTSLNGTCFDLEYGPQGFIQGTGTGTLVTNVTTPYSISNLSANTWYDVYVRDCCNPNAWTGPIAFKTLCLSQLSGTYTINKNLPASATNFESIVDFVDALNNCGVSGPVIANVVAGSGPYVEQVNFAAIVGASATNTITINGNNQRLAFASLNTNLRGTLIMDGAAHIIINDLEIEGTGTTNCYAVELRNGANNLTFDGCYIHTDIAQTSSLVNPFVMSDNPTSATTASAAFNNITIKNGIIEGGYYGLILNGPTAAGPWSTGNVIENNEIRDFYLYGIYGRGQLNASIKGNNITRSNRTAITTFYGMFLTGQMEGVTIDANEVHHAGGSTGSGSFTAYPYYLSSVVGTPTSPVRLTNNLLYEVQGTGTIYGVYIIGTSTNVQLYHNTLDLSFSGTSTGTIRNIFISSTSGNFDIRNNILSATHSGTGTKHLIYLSSTVPTYTINYNHYHMAGGGTGNHIGYYGTNFTTLANWQTANSSAFDQNGVQGDPVFASPITFNMTPLSSAGNNVAQNLNTVAPADFYGVTRGTTPDIGAIEFTPLTADISLISGSLERGTCFSTADTVTLGIQNVIGSTVNFATTPISATWSVTGPINSNGTITWNTGTLASGATTTGSAFSVNMSTPGIYTLNAHLQANANNQFAGNDTLISINLEVRDIFKANPQSDTVLNAIDSVEISVQSPFLGGGDFFITEICHFAGATTGLPVGGKPSWLLADDYIEITGVPGSDLAGYTLEQWSTTAIMTTYTFPTGTVLSPNGTCILGIGQMGSSVPSPANYYYHGVPATPTPPTFSSGGSNGRILKNPNGVIIDAVGSAATYVFPATTGVTTADWSTSAGIGSHTSTWGIRLQGPDLNGSPGWIVSSATNPQNPNILNANVTLPNPQGIAGFSWSLNGSVVDTNVTIHVGPWANPGVYHYVATLTNSPCGTLYDTVTIYVNFTVACLSPSNIATANLSCAQVNVSWSSDPNKLTSYIEYGAAGFTPGTGTQIANAASPQNISGLSPGTTYDVYIIDSCAAGLSTPAMHTVITPTGPLPTATATGNVTVTFSQADVQFDASASTGYTSLSWDFGDGTSGTGVNPSHTYLANGTYTVVLTATNDCGSTQFTFTVVVAGINIEESMLGQTLNLYPNPNSGNFRVEFEVEGEKEVELRIISILGQTVYQSKPSHASGKYNVEIDLSSQAAGVYILQITTDDGTVSRRVTVRK
jgi:hypothetical protein